MLSTTPIYAVLPATDLGRAEAFYRDKLGLEPTQRQDGTLIYTTGAGSTFQIYETPNAGTAENTQMGWATDDFETEIQQLRDRGIRFEDYDFPELTTINGVADLPDVLAAWFKDSEGNILCVSHTK
jgi:catechol-2,3-dioxygenase